MLTDTCRSLDHSRAKSHACQQQPLRSKRATAGSTKLRRFTLAPSTAEFRPSADFRPAGDDPADEYILTGGEDLLTPAAAVPRDRTYVSLLL
ncbi:hypothetical protein F511_02138 [Dorcoceras hygrometricum]|uniref:Uncharacterized protein n=1 Tax=Dorcoceras hygrometricum TaxID=472368 RepID=A0A2Z7D9V0_9LAMI|nr:hypothetical protein F511_02138 [Dorcoceras hygrometricum]